MGALNAPICSDHAMRGYEKRVAQRPHCSRDRAMRLRMSEGIANVAVRNDFTKAEAAYKIPDFNLERRPFEA